MKKIFVLMCVAIMCFGCSAIEDKIDDEINDRMDDYEDNYCDGMSDDDGDGYYMKEKIPGPVFVFDKLMSCDGVIMSYVYRSVSYSVLRVSDCKYGTAKEDELLSYTDCLKLEEVPDEYEPELAIN